MKTFVVHNRIEVLYVRTLTGVCVNPRTASFEVRVRIHFDLITADIVNLVLALIKFVLLTYFHKCNINYKIDFII